MIEINDFDNLDQIAKEALAKLLQADPATQYWCRKRHGDLKLKFRIIKHLSADKPKNGIPGRRVRYEVVDNELFARGTYGDFYRCRYTLAINDKGDLEVIKRKPGKVRLVKVQPIKVDLANRLDQIENEATSMQESDVLRAVSGLPEIFHAKPLVRVGNLSYIFMRELPGAQLFDLINEGKLSIQERYELSIALLHALQEQIHDLGFIHNDLKPENILVYRDDKGAFKVLIIDFGFVKKQTIDDSQLSRGSPIYAAPECYRLGVNKNEKSDIYSLGKVLMVLWGYIPKGNQVYRAEALAPNFDGLFEGIDMPECHEEIKDILKRMCAVDMDERPDITENIEAFSDLSDQLAPIGQAGFWPCSIL